MGKINVSTDVKGAREAVRLLKQTQPEAFKEFRAQAQTAIKPIVLEARRLLDAADSPAAGIAPLSGFRRKWSPGGRQIFPWSQQKALSGVKIQIRPSKEAFLTVTQRQAGPAIADIAGRKNRNKLGTALNKYGKASRFMWPAAEAKQPEIEKNLEQIMDFVSKKTSTKLKF